MFDVILKRAEGARFALPRIEGADQWVRPYTRFLTGRSKLLW